MFLARHEWVWPESALPVSIDGGENDTTNLIPHLGASLRPFVYAKMLVRGEEQLMLHSYNFRHAIILLPRILVLQR